MLDHNIPPLRFRVRAFNEIGSSVPGIASDAFVIDTPGVHIAILTDSFLYNSR